MCTQTQEKQAVSRVERPQASTLNEDNVLDFDLPELQAKIETDPTHQPGTLGPRPVEIPAQPLQRGPSSRGGIETTDPRHQPGTLGPRPVETPA
ncbi:uncharacterized protein LOC144107492 isoform X3 [Amblyomma americanum]